MSSDIFTEINKIKLDLSPEQVAELSKFNTEVISYISSLSQNFVTFDIIHRQCKQYSAKKDIPLNLTLRDKILKTIRKREAKHRKVSRSNFLEQYNVLFNDTVKDAKNV